MFSCSWGAFISSIRVDCKRIVGRLFSCSFIDMFISWYLADEASTSFPLWKLKMHICQQWTGYSELMTKSICYLHQVTDDCREARSGCGTYAKLKCLGKEAKS